MFYFFADVRNKVMKKNKNNEFTLVTITNVTKKEHSIYENYGKVINNIDPTIKAEVQSKIIKNFYKRR